MRVFSLLVLFGYRGMVIAKLLKTTFMFLKSLEAAEWMFRLKRLFSEYLCKGSFLESSVAWNGSDMNSQCALFPLQEQPTCRDRCETEVFFLHLNNAGRELAHYCELEQSLQ